MKTLIMSTLEKARVVDALCRTDFVSFIRKGFHTLMPNSPLQMNFHIYAMAFCLELVRLGIIKRLIINIATALTQINRNFSSVSSIHSRSRSKQTRDRGQL